MTKGGTYIVLHVLHVSIYMCKNTHCNSVQWTLTYRYRELCRQEQLLKLDYV